MATACHDSYPLNSDIARPPGTFAAYLSLSCAEMARPPTTASHTTAIPIVSTLLRFIAPPFPINCGVVSLLCGTSSRLEYSRPTDTHRTIRGVMNRVDWTLVSVDTLV